jgi:hypothetical protein
MGAESNPVGAPKISPEDYNPEWKEQMLEAYKNGKSNVWVKVNCFNDHRVSDDLWYRWLEEEEELSGTVKLGKQMSQAYWEDVSQEHANGTNTDANATSLIFNMSNRFKDEWKQRQSVEQTTKHSLDVNSLDELQDFLEENGVNIDDL